MCNEAPPARKGRGRFLPCAPYFDQRGNFMSTGKTTYLRLHRWEPDDDFLRTEFNENSDKLDEELQGMQKEMTGEFAAVRGELTSGLSAVRGELTQGLSGKATATHSHGAGDITSGTLPVARGGTGNTSVDTTPTSGSSKMVTSGGVYTALSGKAASSHSHTPASLGAQATVTGAATTITGANLTANRALISNGSGKVAVSTVTSTELGYLDGVTAAIQTQLNSKQAASTAAHVETASYAGTGVTGSGNPCSITFSFAPKMIYYVGAYSASAADEQQSAPHVYYCDLLTTSWKQAKVQVFGSSYNTVYFKKSSDGKTISWYTSSDGKAYEQLNSTGYTYCFVAFG